MPLHSLVIDAKVRPLSKHMLESDSQCTLTVCESGYDLCLCEDHASDCL